MAVSQAVQKMSSFRQQKKNKVLDLSSFEPVS